MKRRIIALFALTALVILAAPTYAQSGCTSATLKGSYGLSLNGSVGGVSTAAVGLVTADGEGNFSITYTISENGTVTTGEHAVGTYTVNADCTGSVTDLTNNLHYTIVVLRHGAEGLIINRDPGSIYLGDFKKQ